MYSGDNLSLQMIHDTDSHDAIAELIFDVAESRVNVFNEKTVRELTVALEVLQQQSGVAGLLIRSAKAAFIAGADISEFTPAFLAGADKITELLRCSNQNFNAIEALPFPVVVAINGFALGGGCELTLACDYRIASDDVRIGLPETRLGIIPGWGGTVRLPRIAGIETAVEWIAGAKEYRASAALNAGVIDGVATLENLREAALLTLQQAIVGKLDFRARRQQKAQPLKHNKTELAMALMTSKAMVAAQAGRHYPAPLAAVDVIAASARVTAAEALKQETATFIAMTQTSAALALTRIFLNDQIIAKKAKAYTHVDGSKAAPVKQAAVIGAGIMGGGIAYQSALKGIPIIMKDIDVSGIELGLEEANALLSKRVERGRLSPQQMGQVLNRIEPTLHYAGFDSVDIVIEAVVENPDIKQSVLADVEQHVHADTVIASNTSTISISHLASSLQRPENVCGMHFFNPVHAMPLVEVIRGHHTSDQAVATTVAYATAMGKKAVVVQDCPGFLVNRVLFPYLAAFLMLVRDGVNFRRIDKVMEAWGWPMGPAYLLDVVGIDTAVHGAKVMAEGFPERMQYDFVAATDLLQAENRLGQKTGSGFYEYSLDKKGKRIKSNSDDVDVIIASGIQAIEGVTDINDEAIIERMMTPMAIELIRCLEEGVVGSPAEADMAMVYGIGFPPFVGGLFQWIDSIGINKIMQSSEKYSYLSKIYSSTDNMQDRVLKQKTYYGSPPNADGFERGVSV
ncbi:fatty acid oxidation complex subunit alpha FadB [Eionea flava]